MTIGDLFKTQKALSSKNLNDAVLDIEAPEYAETVFEDRGRIEPRVDYSTISSFVKFGSAKKYYEDGFNRITKTYPYDGSGNEKLKWKNENSTFDNYIYDNLYPKHNGYLVFSHDGVASTTTIDSIPYSVANSPSYVKFFGSMNSGSYQVSATNMSSLKAGFAGSNVYDAEKFRTSNLYFNPSYGNTVEFWYKAGLTPLSSSSVLFDLWNGKSRANPDYGRLTIELAGSVTGSSNLLITYLSGSTGFTKQVLGGFDDATDWNHYAVSLSQEATDAKLEFYLNNSLNESVTSAVMLNEVTGSLVGYIGSLAETAYVGQGGISGSMDEFRFWKKKRDHKEIGRNWFTQVNGGSNTEDSSYVNLGVYYKFNEGITGYNSDSVILDYSGRTTNGTIINFSSNMITRNLGSAMVSASVAPSEKMDPVVWPNHPELVSTKALYVSEGENYDYYNNSSIFHALPEWIVEDDGKDGELSRMTQIMGSYFDSLYLMIKELPKLNTVQYVSGSDKSYPFVSSMLHSKGFKVDEIFENEDQLAQLYSRDEGLEFEDTLSNIKNTIYSNIYNNLTEIYKTKGTEASFRNLLRCYGIDESLVKTNYYSNFEKFEINDSYTNTSATKKYVNFNHVDRNGGTIYMQTSSLSVQSDYGYIYGSGIAYEEKSIPMTIESDIIFPQQYNAGNILYDDSYSGEITSSLFGFHTAITGSVDLAWQTGSAAADVQVYAVRDKQGSPNAYFMLSSSFASFPTITSSIIEDLYSDERWNLAVRIKPANSQPGFVSGSTAGPYEVELYGVSMILDQVAREFKATGSLSNTDGMNALCMPKRLYAGAYRQDFTGIILQSTNVKLGGLKYWTNYVDDAAIKAHGLDIKNVGSGDKNDYNYIANGYDYKDLSPRDYLAMDWTFSNVTTSDTSGEFDVYDATSEREHLLSVPVIGPMVGNLHQGIAYGFPESSPDVVEKQFLSTGRFTTPDNLDPRSLVRIIEQDDVSKTPNSRPSKYFISFEKSMYSSISDEMISWFGGMKQFNNLIGSPKNRYMFEYKGLGSLREKFFDGVQNTPDLEKYFELYRWIDGSISNMLLQLVPASAKTNDIFNVIEGHAFERNKYWNKLPTTEYRYADPEINAKGIGEFSINWAYGHAPIDQSMNSNCPWWKDRWEKPGTVSETFIRGAHASNLSNNDLVRISSAMGPTGLDLAKLVTPKTFKNNSFSIDVSSIVFPKPLCSVDSGIAPEVVAPFGTVLALGPFANLFASENITSMAAFHGTDNIAAATSTANSLFGVMGIDPAVTEMWRWVNGGSSREYSSIYGGSSLLSKANGTLLHVGRTAGSRPIVAEIDVAGAATWVSALYTAFSNLLYTVYSMGFSIVTNKLWLSAFGSSPNTEWAEVNPDDGAAIQRVQQRPVWTGYASYGVGVGDGVVCEAGTDGLVRGWDESTYADLWSHDVAIGVGVTSAGTIKAGAQIVTSADGSVFYVTRGDGGLLTGFPYLNAFDAVTGAELWEVNLASAEYCNSSCGLGPGCLYLDKNGDIYVLARVGTTKGHINRIRPDGTKVYSSFTDFGIRFDMAGQTQAMCVSHTSGIIYAGDVNGNIYTMTQS